MDAMEKLRKRPYKEIISCFERTLPATGGKISEYVTLINPSLIMPKFKYKDRGIRSTISVLVLGCSGSGKTTFLELFKPLLYNPFEFEYITPAKIAKELSEVHQVTLLVNDMARVMGNKDTVKVMEGVLEEGKFKHLTMRPEYNLELSGALLGVSVLQDISSHITSGLLFRVVPIFVDHDLDEQEQIGKDIANNIGKESSESITLADIKNYYDELRAVQEGKLEKSVVAFDVSQEQREVLYDGWARALERLGVDEDTLWFRELLDGFRFTCSLGLLNYWERERETLGMGCVLKPNEDDLKTAKRLMFKEMLTKYDVFKLTGFKKIAKKIRKKINN